ncbi:vacuolar protein sorting-associated protein 13A-like [Exaiptasia diaphana]|uniref:Intermembrane lipid transfer protein VPS13-like C-terminal domain-containing protein n=1 Tax=Exaiptasia diaphana TaxID=2652724 RepID=A0A913XVP3_EXADI|nr:vacuolar protein sorting-associated protein 13A-like [Exaiptasia diaphana]
MHIEPSGIGQGLMMGGKSLVMGLVFGIGGIVMKPIEGARTEGVEGFFKGTGKGLLGVLTRPTGGVIDMVSFTFDGIRRSAEQGGEDIACRMRHPRFAAPNEPLKPYSKQEAIGFGTLKSLPRSLELSKDVYESDFKLNDDGRLVLLTSKRIIMLNQSRFWREWNWKVEWMCPYEEVKSTPFIAVDTLVIKYQKSSDDDITSRDWEAMITVAAITKPWSIFSIL